MACGYEVWKCAVASLLQGKPVRGQAIRAHERRGTEVSGKGRSLQVTRY